MRAAAAAIGVVFGAMLIWSGMADPDVIRDALLFRESYLFLFMFSAMAVATAGQLVLRRTGRDWLRQRPERRHITGSVIFGIGWGVSNACPGPIAAQLGQGMGWAAFTLIGVAIGIHLYQREGGPETEPATDPVGTVHRMSDERAYAPAR
jgi:uncharacterized membrane protein YedE/YeeE